ncbi:Ribosomal RNA small subunit methyltransferase H [Calycomorphotria hydatis]|uniref:Ribosomal RNA small subunit methyltransferase H n=2 Tax=Calycomorphotria hydatis TaxID=2528027 RepID=A0A517T9D4_9PLAN|nr:Ribosomal RNA small subunit methyltransferase H [Calycomorphotria hydatis]
MQALQLQPGMVVVDGTLGAAGHSTKIIEQIGTEGLLIGIDRDPMMLALASKNLEAAGYSNAVLIQGSHSVMLELLEAHQLPKPDRVLLDLGYSSDQLADESRGFSFDAEGPLDLRFDTSVGQPAWKLLQQSSVDDLEQIFREFGEEPQAHVLANAIANHRSATSAAEFSQMIADTLKSSRSNTHPATRAFQALRIAVNAELQHVHTTMHEVLPEVLNTSGRAVVISFHSLEDRIVKDAFRSTDHWSDRASKPITPTPAETRLNPRARSAKLRYGDVAHR